MGGGWKISIIRNIHAALWAGGVAVLPNDKQPTKQLNHKTTRQLKHQTPSRKNGTKGDANNTEDKTIERSQIIGKVTKVFPNINTWKKVFTSPTVLTSIIITVILFAIAFSVEDNNLRDDIK